MSTLGAAESTTVKRGAALPRELGLLDLTPTQILFVVGLPWVGVAAKQGTAHIALWLMG